MVNTGKPSRGCYMCRARRIKCDEAKPSCMRCQKSKRVCPGYRDAFELKLRDDTKSAKKRPPRQNSPVLGPGDKTFSQALFLESRGNLINYSKFENPAPTVLGLMAHRRHKSESSVQSEDFMYDFLGAGPALQVHRNHHSLIYHMTTPVHQQAACYFLSNFVMMPVEGTRRGYLDFILPLLKEGQPNRPLMHAFSAAALAALGTRPNSKALIPQADVWYLEALKEINMALQDPVASSSDSTLAAVMLLASFEQLVPSRMRVGGWASHIDGAVAMIKTRPQSAWQSGILRELFISVRSHMTIQCIANSRGADASIDWLSVSTGDAMEDKFAQMSLKVASLRADNDKITPLATHSTESLEKVLKLLRRAESLEKEYAQWTANLSSSWAMRTVAWVDADIEGSLVNSVVHPGKVVAYRDLFVAYHYNVVRACRLCIWTVILRCVAWMNNPRDYRMSPEYSTASAACRVIIEDMVSSVPFFFGWKADVEPAMAGSSTYACGIANDMSVKGLAGVFVMWPVFLAATSDFASPSQRIYLRGRLQYISDQMGINQAGIMLQAQLMHPSLYIAHEKKHLEIPEILDTSLTDTPSAVQVPRPTLDSGNWIPRSFLRPNVEPDVGVSVTDVIMEDIVGPIGRNRIVEPSDFDGYNNYEHELASYDMPDVMQDLISPLAMEY